MEADLNAGRAAVSSKRTAPAFSTSSPVLSTVAHAMRVFGTSSTMRASHSTVVPSGPRTFQCVTCVLPSRGSTDSTSGRIWGRLVSPRQQP